MENTNTKEFMLKQKNYIINISGGAGKNVMFSAVAKNIKRDFPEHNLIVISPYPELLINCKDIDRIYKTGSTPYLYEDFLQGEGHITSSIEPYGDDGYLQEKEHLIQTWSKLLGATPIMQMPEISINYREMLAFRNNLSASMKIDKPILVINPFGGPSNQEMKYNWCRDIPPTQAQELVDFLNSEGKYNIIQIVREDQIKLKNCNHFTGNFREICSLLKISEKRILIDSFCQHAAAALQLPSTVCWITNKPIVFGYNIHKNIQAITPTKIVHRIDSVFQSDNWNGSWYHYYPYNDDKVFDLKEIIQSL